MGTGMWGFLLTQTSHEVPTLTVEQTADTAKQAHVLIHQVALFISGICPILRAM